MKKEIMKEIHNAIEYVWKYDIASDYNNEFIWKEASLKCSLYRHLNNRLETLLRENNIRIYPEYYIKDARQYADLAILEMKKEEEYKHIKEHVKQELVIIELKFFSKENNIDWAKGDIFKMKSMLQKYGIDCHYYFGVIFENDCEWLYFMDKRSTNNWAKGRVTELNAGYIDGELRFEVNRW